MEQLKVYIDRLKGGDKQKISCTLAPSVLDVQEEELTFPEDVQVTGEIYLADDHLIGHLNAKTTALMPCAMCNSITKVLIHIKDEYITVPLAEVRSAIYDLTPDIREMLLLQVPQFVECHEGKCPERETLKNYLAKPGLENTQSQSQPVHFPFADLDKK
ncbi:MAG: hypothetical protein K2P51_00180 [Rhabdochlamydiaceae bacterium]|nr:hypothetical protein [Rhabdochlamydiaceae bacterium]